MRKSNSPTKDVETTLAWHALPIEKVVSELGSDPTTGLTTEEAQALLTLHGPNVLDTGGGESSLRRLLRQFHDPLVWILIACGAIAGGLGEWIDGGVIFGVVIINALIGYFQETKAAKAIEALSRSMETTARVRRNGTLVSIPATALVPGDIVELAAGDKIPADIRFFASASLRADESVLTGESVPVAKEVAELPAQTSLGDRLNIGYASTLVTYGQGVGIVVGTGSATELGRIRRLLATADDIDTPLTRKLDEFSKVLLYLIAGLAAATFAIGLLRGDKLFDTFIAAVALAVGAIPEGLPAAFTVTLAVGVNRMAQRKAIIRRLPAVETLGSTSVVCSDKTGTLTQNEMTVRYIVCGGERYQVDGVGYAPEGSLRCSGETIQLPEHPALESCLRIGVLCNDSSLAEEGSEWTITGDPTEAAIVVAARKAGLRLEALRAERRALIPFESEYQLMAVLQPHEGDQQILVKGSVEAVSQRCGHVLLHDGQLAAFDADATTADAETMAAQGLRVLAFARKAARNDATTLEMPDIADDLIFCGLMAMIDPPRPEAIQAVHACKQAGIQVKMVTGDHALTATAIARELGIIDANIDASAASLSGVQISATEEQELERLVLERAVFARVSPEQKIQLVRILQKAGHVVAMTGDGVNDAPALQQADIGVAMGKGGTDVARASSDMILTDDNFATIEAAIEEGRGVFDNLTKILAWLMPTNIGIGLIIVAAIAMGTVLPLLPLQVLFINMTTVGILGLVLAMEPREGMVMARPPRAQSAPILTRALSLRIVLVSVLILIAAFGAFQLELSSGGSLPAARMSAMNSVVFIELFYLLNCRTLSVPLHKVPLMGNPWLLFGAAALVALQLAVTYLPLANKILHTAPVSGMSWLVVIASGVITLIIVELVKWREVVALSRAPRP